MVGGFVRFCCAFRGDPFVGFLQSWSGFTYRRVETLTRWEGPNICLSIVSLNPLWQSSNKYDVPSMTPRDSGQRQGVLRFDQCCSCS